MSSVSATSQIAPQIGIQIAKAGESEPSVKKISKGEIIYRIYTSDPSSGEKIYYINILIPGKRTLPEGVVKVRLVFKKKEKENKYINKCITETEILNRNYTREGLSCTVEPNTVFDEVKFVFLDAKGRIVAETDWFKLSFKKPQKK